MVVRRHTILECERIYWYKSGPRWIYYKEVLPFKYQGVSSLRVINKDIYVGEKHRDYTVGIWKRMDTQNATLDSVDYTYLDFV